MSLNTPKNVAVRTREQDLAGKVAVITGASKGIGRATALNLASRGCSILGTCSNLETLHLIDSLANEISNLYKAPTLPSGSPPPRIVGMVANVTSPDDCAADIASNVKQHFGGHLDIYVNNAAFTGLSKIGELQAEHVSHYCLGNIQTPTLVVDELVKRRMFRKESRIVLISSDRSKKVSPKTTMYCVTKAAGEALVRCWAEAFGGKDPEFDFMAGTTANSLLVGLTKTDAVNRHGAAAVERVKQEFVPEQAIPRIAEPEDVADVVGLLCSRDARWITGSVVSADGGCIMIC